MMVNHDFSLMKTGSKGFMNKQHIDEEAFMSQNSAADSIHAA